MACSGTALLYFCGYILRTDRKYNIINFSHKDAPIQGSGKFRLNLGWITGYSGGGFFLSLHTSVEIIT
jgi:hypothetical protein